MLPQQIEELKKLDASQKVKQLSVYLISSDISADELLSIYNENLLGLKFSGEDFFNIACKCHDGKKYDYAFKLFSYMADNCKYYKAYWPCAHYYFNGTAGNLRDVNLALKYALLAWEKDESLQGNESFMLLYAAIWLEIGCAREINLKKMYEKVDDIYSITSQAQVDQVEQLAQRVEKLKLASPPGWIALNDYADGFDGQSDELLKQAQQKKLRHDELKARLPGLTSKINKLNREIIDGNKEGEEQKRLVQSRDKLQQAKEELEIEQNELSSPVNAYERYADVTSQTIRRQFKVEDRFFNPRRTKNQSTLNTALQLEKRRLSSRSIAEPIVVTNTPTRRLITAERSTIENSKQLLSMQTNGHDYLAIENGEVGIGWGIDHGKTTHTTGSYRVYPHYWSCDEKIEVGKSCLSYCQKIDCHKNHLGDFYMYDLGSYERIFCCLRGIVSDDDQKLQHENEIRLAKLMLEFCHHGKPVDLEALKTVNPNKNDLSEEDVTNINRIFYHAFVKEITRWLLPDDKSHELPLATAQARALKLIILGCLSLADVFSQNASYGVFAVTYIGNDAGQKILKEKIVRINELYREKVLEKDKDENADHVRFYKEHPEGKTVPTYKELHGELREVFGGESDTDGEGYESDGERETQVAISTYPRTCRRA